MKVGALVLAGVLTLAAVPVLAHGGFGQALQAELPTLFAQADADGDGSLTVDEFKTRSTRISPSALPASMTIGGRTSRTSSTKTFWLTSSLGPFLLLVGVTRPSTPTPMRPDTAP